MTSCKVLLHSCLCPGNEKEYARPLTMVIQQKCHSVHVHKMYPECICSISNSPHFVLAFFQKWITFIFCSTVYTQYPIMTMWKMYFCLSGAFFFFLQLFEKYKKLRNHMYTSTRLVSTTFSMKLFLQLDWSVSSVDHTWCGIAPTCLHQVPPWTVHVRAQIKY